MGFPKDVKERAAVACNRSCCLCHQFKGLKLEFHHIKQRADGGEDTFENCIPLCFDCHGDMGGVNPRHPKGNAYSERELRMHRDKWYEQCAVTENVIENVYINTYAEIDALLGEPTVTLSNQAGLSHQNSYLSVGHNGTFTFDYSNNDGKYTIGTGEYEFVTRWSKASNTSIHAYKDSLGVNGAIARVKAPVEWPTILDTNCDFSSRVRTPEIGDIIIWKNTNGKHAATKIVSIKDDTRGADHDELTCEYIIYK